MNLLGIAGESNRRKLAEMFLRPTTWGDYCTQVSNTSCAVPDNVAQRPPSEEEVDKMHSPNLYTGYFRATEENDCDKFPDNCTGHGEFFHRPCYLLGQKDKNHLIEWVDGYSYHVMELSYHQRFLSKQ